MKQLIRKTVCLTLALVLLLGLLPALRLPAAAAGVPIDSNSFPDDTFRSFVKQYDKNSNDSFSAAELSAVTQMDCSNRSIFNLTGIEYFTELTDLNCAGNNLSFLDVRNNTLLERLDCRNNRLRTLLLGTNEVLYQLSCQGNRDLDLLDLTRTPKLRDAYRKGAVNLSNPDYYRFIWHEQYVESEKDQDFDAHYIYPLFICGTEVDEYNRADVLGNGVFSFDGGRLLTVKGICESDQIIINNVGVENLRIKVSKTSRLSTTNNNVILAQANTAITGPSRLILACSHDHGTGIHAFNKDVTIRIEEADLRVEAYFGINGSFHESSCKLIVNHSAVQVEAENGGIYDFPGGISLYDVKIVAPEGGRLSDSGMSIVTASHGKALSVTMAPTVRSNPFTDVPENKYYRNPALWAYYRKPRITSGATATSFGPGKECKREQVMTFLWKAAGAPEPETDSCPFTDVPKNKYYYKPIVWAVENGITGGVSSTKFGVGRACTREQVMTFLWKYGGAPEPLSFYNPFNDVSNLKYYYYPVLWAVENKITSGVSSTKFGVGRTCNRGEVVTFLYKFMAG